MAEVEIKVDATRAIAKLDRIPPAMRNRLRQVIPGLVNRLASAVNNKLGTQLKSHTTLSVNKTMTENANSITGSVALESPSAGGLLPTYLEQGTAPHTITGNPVLAFPWDFMGGYGGSVSKNTTMAFFRRVRHPGTRAYGFMRITLAEQQASITQALREAVQSVARESR